MPVQHALGRLVQQRLDPPGDAQVEVEARFERFAHVGLFRLVAGHGGKQVVAVEKVRDVEHALRIGMIGGDGGRAVPAMDIVKGFGTAHQLGAVHVDRSAGPQRFAAQRAAGPGHLPVCDLVGLPGDRGHEHHPQVRPHGGNAVGGPVEQKLGSPHLGIPHSLWIVEAAAIVGRVVERPAVGGCQQQRGPSPLPELPMSLQLVVHGMNPPPIHNAVEGPFTMQDLPT